MEGDLIHKHLVHRAGGLVNVVSERGERGFSGETDVFSGKLWALNRKDARAIVERLGGTTDDDVTQRTTQLVLGSETYPDGVPDISRLVNDTGTHSQKLRRAAQLNAEQPGKVRMISVYYLMLWPVS